MKWVNINARTNFLLKLHKILQEGGLAFVGVLYMSNTLKKVLILTKSIKPIVSRLSIVLVLSIIALAMMVSTHDSIVLDFSHSEQGTKVRLVICNDGQLK